MAGSDGGAHKGHRHRVREKFLKSGFDGFAEHEILEFLLFYCIPRKNTNLLAHKILDKYKTLANVFDAPIDELMAETGISENTAALLSTIPSLSRIYETSKWKRINCLKNTEEAGQFAVSMLKDKIDEEFAIICLDANRCVHWSGTILKGTIDATPAYPRKVAAEALKHNAAKIILTHNHPSGTLISSVADKESTEIITKALKGIGIEVLDHIIVSGTRYFSMKEAGFRF